ncbi:glycoside hydrolase family 43 protein [Sphaerobolus stellatus SS14]|nr:glycoside hydrolase family 43 protein [Sphaerobolus stellatus SS14]
MNFPHFLLSSLKHFSGQCGGQGWTGPTTCISGYVCQYSNPYYSQCVAGTTTTANPTTSNPTTTGKPATSTTTTAAPSSTQSYNQPILWNDLADLDIFRVNNTFYYSASTMHYSPGAPILQSYDLVNWEYIGHSVPVLDWSSKYDLTNGQRAYVKGIWASSLKYRQSNGLFYWIGCIEFSTTYVYTAPSAAGPWTKRSSISTCYYDAGLLIDDATDTLYVAYGSTNISVAQLSADGLSQVSTKQVWASPSSVGDIEGSRMYKINGNYYILNTQPAGAEWVLKSTSGPFGPYTQKVFVSGLGNPVPGGGVPHQGGIVDTPSGGWYYMGFCDSYPGGRVPVMAPISWGSDGFPVVQTVNNAFGTSYPYPLPAHPLQSYTGTDSFSGSSLNPVWEWNHNPDTTKFSVNNGLTLQTATVTSDLYSARNSLTHRILGPTSTATIILTYSSMHDGDRAGLTLLRDQSSWIGVRRDSGTVKLTRWSNITMDMNWNTTNIGSEIAAGPTLPVTGRVWLRVAADIRPSSSSPQGVFSYSTDGNTFTTLGSAFVMDTTWEFFMGYRYAIINYATTALGGSVSVSSFTISTP